MYGKPVTGPLQTAAGVSMLPATGDSKVLFIVAASLITTGVIIMIASAIVARRGHTNVAN